MTSGDAVRFFLEPGAMDEASGALLVPKQEANPDPSPDPNPDPILLLVPKQEANPDPNPDPNPASSPNPDS